LTACATTLSCSRACHQHDRRRLRSKLELRGIAAQSLNQLVAHDLDDLFPGRKRCRHLLPDSLVPNVIDELFDDFEVNVGFEQRQPDFAQRLLHVLFVENGLATQGLKGALKFFGKVLEHKLGSYFSSRHWSKLCRKRSECQGQLLPDKLRLPAISPLLLTNSGR
jgi:hypothetical protein